MPGAPKPTLEQLLVAAALDPVLCRLLVDSPDEVFPLYHLSDEEREILRARDHRLLALLGRALARQNPSPPAVATPADAVPQQPEPGGHQLPDMQLALTVVPVLMNSGGQQRGLTFAAWVNPLPEGVDPESLPMPDGASLPGQPLAPLRAVIHVSSQQLPDLNGVPQVGMTARLLRSSNISIPAAEQSAGAPGEDDGAAPDIWIAGLGITTAGQVTREVEQAIRASNEVLYLDTGIATRPFLQELCPRVTSLYELTYSEERPRESGYERMAARVMEAALDHPPVTLAIHGHPLIAATAPFLVLEQARAQGLRVRVLPGVSAVDTVLADLRVDPVVHGIQMYEATDLLLRRRPLLPDVPALIWQIGPLETCLHSMRVSAPERFTRFVEHLRLFYPARHEVAAVYSSPHALVGPHILRFAIEDMGLHAREIHAGFTLYIPPVAGRPIEDYDLLGKLNSPDHLRHITAGDLEP